MSDPITETSSSVSVTSEEVARQIEAETDSLTQQLAHLCVLMDELRNVHAHRRHKETASSRAASKSTSSTGWFDKQCMSHKNRNIPQQLPDKKNSKKLVKNIKCLSHIRSSEVTIFICKTPLWVKNS